MKAVIPVAGIGTRLRPHTHTQPKSLIPVAGKPILSHIIDSLTAAGYDEFVFIIGYLGDKIESYISQNYPHIRSHFVIQTTGKGTGNAIWLAKDQLKDDEEIMIVFGDTIFDTDLRKVQASKYSSLGVKKVDDPRDFGVAELNAEGFVSKLVEKPLIPKSNLALVGLYKIKETGKLKEALDYIIQHDVRSRNEYHLTDALMMMIEKGVQFQTFDVDNWFDCGKKEILLETNALLLKRANIPTPNSKDYPNTIIIPPVFIGANSQVSNSIIGPNVSIGDNAIVNYSIIKETIIGPHSHIENAILQQSLIGNDAYLKGMIQSLNLGDSTEINFT